MDNEPLLPVSETPTQPQMPSPKAQSWGAVISIFIIVMMIVVGAFYSWGKRIAEQTVPVTPSTEQ